MGKWMFVIGMIVQGVIIRLQFIVYAGFDSGIDISHIDKKKVFPFKIKFLRVSGISCDGSLGIYKHVLALRLNCHVRRFVLGRPDSNKREF